MNTLDLFIFDDYKIYIRDRVKLLPRNGHGVYTKLAAHLSVSSVYVSQVFNGEREVTMEQAIPIAEYFGLSELETDYFITLVERARSGTHSLYRYYTKKLAQIRSKSKKIKEVLSNQKELSEEDKAEFYSQWYYMAVWLLTSMGTFSSPEQYGDKLRLDLKTINKIIDFLQRNNFIIKNGEFFAVGHQFIHLESESIHVSRHHTHWRLRSLTQLERMTDDELCFTMPCSISKNDFEKIRANLVKVIKESRNIIGPSPAEELAFLNIDWMKLKI